MESSTASDGTPPDYEAPVAEDLETPTGPATTVAGFTLTPG